MKRTLIIISLLILLLALPSLYQVYHIYLSSPSEPEIAEEDYTLLGNEAPFRMQPLPEDQVEVTVDQETAKQVVEVKTDGFKLLLDPELQVVTREVEPGRILIYKGDCRITVSRKEFKPKFSSVEEYIEAQVDREWDEVKRNEVKKIELESHQEAYEWYSQTGGFPLFYGIILPAEENIFILGDGNNQGQCISLKKIANTLQYE